MLLSFAEVNMVTPGNQRRKIRTLFSTGRGFLAFPYECETTTTGVLFVRLAVSMTCSINIRCATVGTENLPYVNTTDFINNVKEYIYGSGGHSNIFEHV